MPAGGSTTSPTRPAASAGCPGGTVGSRRAIEPRHPHGPVDEHAAARHAEGAQRAGESEHHRGALGRPHRQAEQAGQRHVRCGADGLVHVVDGRAHEPHEVGVGEQCAVLPEPRAERRRSPPRRTPDRRARPRATRSEQPAGGEHGSMEPEPCGAAERRELPEPVDEALGGTVAFGRLEEGGAQPGGVVEDLVEAHGREREVERRRPRCADQGRTVEVEVAESAPDDGGPVDPVGDDGGRGAEARRMDEEAVGRDRGGASARDDEAAGNAGDADPIGDAGLDGSIGPGGWATHVPAPAARSSSRRRSMRRMQYSRADSASPIAVTAPPIRARR